MFISGVKSILTKILPSKVKRWVAAGMNPSPGYENQDLVDLVVWKNTQLRSDNSKMNYDSQAFRIISAVGLCTNSNPSMKVLDFGGGGGHHQLIAKNNFPELQFDWDVVETKLLSKTASALVNEHGLSFFSNLNEIDISFKYDLIFSNSALQYTRDPIETLEILLGLNFRKIFITRIPLTSSAKPLSYIQSSRLSDNGPGLPPKNFSDQKISYETHIGTKSSVESLLTKSLENWIAIEEGSWDPALLGSNVRTYTFIGSAATKS